MTDLLDPVSPFLGRSAALAELELLLCTSGTRLVTLTGTGGSGKTRLALKALGNVTSDFPGGTYVVSLAPIASAVLVLPTIAHALGLHEGAGEQLEQRVVGALGADRTLLLLDNFEHVIDAASVVSSLVQSCPCLVVLVTSRMRLRVQGEREQVVPPLLVAGSKIDETLSEAALLFLDRMPACGDTRSLDDVDIRAIEAICVRLDGLPLAVELAAGWTRTLTPSQLLDRLEPRLPMLVGGNRDAPARQQTVRATIQWSYDLLSPSEEALFRRLGVFRGGFALDSAEAIAGQDGMLGTDRSVLELLAALVETSLVMRVPSESPMPRFTLLETLREFAVEALIETGELALFQQRHAGHFVELAERIGPFLQWQQDTQGSIARLDEEQDNMRAALAWAYEHDREDRLLRLVSALEAYWALRGKLLEARRWLDRALPAADNATPRLRAATVRACAWNARYLGDYHRADTLGQLACDLAVEADDRYGVLHAQTVLGFSAHEQRKFEQATDIFETVRVGALNLGAPIWVAWATRNIGRAAYELGDAAEAEVRISQAISLYEASGCSYGTTEAQAGLAWIAFDRGEYAAAARFWVDRMSSGWDEPGLRLALEGLVQIAVSLGEWRWGAWLLGAVDMHRERLGLQVRPPLREQIDRTVAQLRAALDDAGFIAAWSEGRRCSAQEARALARAFVDSVTDPDAESRRAAHAGLTAREREILQLVAVGRTNRQIAESLFISVPTVKRHLTTAYGKLGVESRAEAASQVVAGPTR